MELTETGLDGVLILAPQVFGDVRGWFTETYSFARLAEHGVSLDFVQDNHSYSAQKGTLRGLHFQNAPKAQTKLIRCTRGSILDVAVDIRKGSPAYLHWRAVVLSSENHLQLLVPKGFAHGFLTLEDDVEVQYKVDEYYSPIYDRGIHYDDPDIGIDWGEVVPLLSTKDQRSPFLKDSDCNFVFNAIEREN